MKKLLIAREILLFETTVKRTKCSKVWLHIDVDNVRTCAASLLHVSNLSKYLAKIHDIQEMQSFRLHSS